jgi:hypothetical protein
MTENSKEYILSEIKRLAAENSSKPLGKERFQKETGIKPYTWNKYWVKFGDALVEAGFKPNKMNEAFPDEFIIEKYISLISELGHFPTNTELNFKCHNDDSYPSKNAMQRLGRQAVIAQKILESDLSRGSNEVINICQNILDKEKLQLSETGTSKVEIGEVYLIKHGNHNEYKIGKSKDKVRRGKELKIEMPQRLGLIHSILTDDPSGVEAYWHRRFKSKNINGEWFALNSDDIKAFKRWKKIV